MASHNAQTGQVTKVRLDSAIDEVRWDRPQASPGGTVGLEVFTRHVGNSAVLKIELTDNSGKTHGTFTDRMHGNHFRAPVRIPTDAKGGLFASVKLSKHGLQQRSPALPLLPEVRITNVRWDRKQVRRGETLRLSADVGGLPEGYEAAIEIFEEDPDGAHEGVARIPAVVRDRKVDAAWEFSYELDTKDIPAAHEAERGYQPPAYFFRVAAGEVSADSGPLQFKDWIGFEARGADGSPCPDAEYVLHLPDGSERKGRLDRLGSAKEEDVPPGPCRVGFPGLKEAQSTGHAASLLDARTGLTNTFSLRSCGSSTASGDAQ
jgi:hypothetical protein